MPVFTTIMVLTNVGLQLINNWRNTKTTEEMRKKQQAFQVAAQERNHDRMMQLLHEGQKLQEEMEAEMHKLRVENIENDFDNIIKQIFQADELKQWPLKVLPMVMKNQSLGTYSKNKNENVALHVILTPSNCDNFNKAVFPQIELGVESFLNRHWNTLSSHPVLFYSGAWKTNTAPTHNDIEQLRTDLSHLPVLMLTPFFKPDDGKLVFNINMWGMGKDKEQRTNNENEEQIQINSQEIVIQPSEKEFSCYNLYAPNMNYGEELTATTIEEFMPYLQCMIGYLADVYFWSAHHIVPLLPHILSGGLIKTNSRIDKEIANAYSEYYLSLTGKGIQRNLSDKKHISSDWCLYPEREISLLQSVITMNHDRSVSDRMINNTLALIYENRTGDRFVSSSTMDVGLLDYDDMRLLSSLNEMAAAYGSKDISCSIKDIIRRKILDWK